LVGKLHHLAYAGGWETFEPLQTHLNCCQCALGTGEKPLIRNGFPSLIAVY